MKALKSQVIVFALALIFVGVVAAEYSQNTKTKTDIPSDQLIQESKHVNLPKNIRVVLENTKPLEFPRGNRLPLYVWPIMGSLSKLDDTQARQVISQLNDRGIAMCVNWSIGAKEKSLAEGLRIGAIQQKLGLRVNVNANACLYSFLHGDERTFHVDEEGKKFYDDSFGGRKMGCPFALRFRYPAMKE